MTRTPSNSLCFGAESPASDSSKVDGPANAPLYVGMPYGDEALVWFCGPRSGSFVDSIGLEGLRQLALCAWAGGILRAD